MYELTGDDMSGDELSGDELAGAMELSGADIGSHSPKVRLRQTTPTQGRRFPIGLGLFADGPVAGVAGQFTKGPNVPAFTPQLTSVEPQMTFRFERLLIPSDFAGNFMILDIKIGVAPVLASKDPVPARVFDETAVGVILGVDTNDPATEITVLAYNFTGLSSPFTGSLIGIAVI